MSAQEKVPFDFSASFIPPYFNTGMFLMEIEKVKLNVRGEPVVTFKTLDSPDGRMVNARRTTNFFIQSDAIKSKTLWTEKFTEVLNALGLKSISDLSVLVGQHLVMAISQAGRDSLPNFRKATDFDKTWQPLSIREKQTKTPF